MSYLMLLLPFAVLLILNLFPRRKMEEIAFWSCILVLVIQASVALISPFHVWGQITSAQLDTLLGFNLYFDKLTYILLFSLALVGLAALIIGHYTIKREHERFNFKNLLLVALIGMNGIAMVKDIFSLYVFIEVTAIATFILIALYKGKYALEGVLKYLVLSVVATTMMLSATALIVLTTGGTSFELIKNALAAPGNHTLLSIAMILFICGLFIKGGMVPFHGWLPDAYATAPAAVSILLAGIVTKASGLFSLARLLVAVNGFSEPIKNLLLLFGAISIVIGALAALGQKDLKRMLAYSSISQMGYIVVGLGTGIQLGIMAAMLHFFNHAIFKAQLFVNAAALEEKLGTQDMEKMGGLAQRMPVTGTTAAIAALSAAGVPPLAGFWSKLFILVALWVSGHYFYALIALIASVITLAYFLTLQRQVFFGRVPEELAGVTEVNFGLLLPAVLLAGVTIIFGLAFPFIITGLVK